MADLCSRHFVYEQYGYLPSSPATGSCQPVTFVSSHFKFYSDVGFPKYWSKIDNDLFHFENAFYSGNMVLVPVFLFIDLFRSIFDFNSSPFHQQRYKCVGIFSEEEQSHEYMHFFRKITNKDWTERKRKNRIRVNRDSFRKKKDKETNETWSGKEKSTKINVSESYFYLNDS